MSGGRVIARVESVEFIPVEFSSILPGGKIAKHADKKGKTKRKKRKGEGDCVYFNHKFGFGLDSSPSNCDYSPKKFLVVDK